MIFLRGKGIIIAKKDIEEADRYITIFMEDYGKVSTVIKGIRKSKKRDKTAVDILSPRAIAAITAALATLHRYPDGSSYALTQALARHLHCAPEMLVLGNGSDEMLGLLVSACMEPGDEAISSFPSFLMYQKCVQIQGCRK